MPGSHGNDSTARVEAGQLEPIRARVGQRRVEKSESPRREEVDGKNGDARRGDTSHEDAAHENAAREDARRDLKHQADLRAAAQLRESLKLDNSLWRLCSAEAQADRELARGLAMLWDQQLYRPLGFVRPTDFIREMLGIRESRARWLTNLGRELIRIPDFDEALAESRISASHVLELSKLIKPETPEAERAAWIERASGKSVRALHKEIQAERLRLANADSKAPPTTGEDRPGDDDDSSNADESSADENSADKSSADKNSADENSADKNSADENSADKNSADENIEIIDLTADPDEAPAGGSMSIPAPQRVAILWHLSLELSRAASGRHLSPGQCAELIFAEFLAANGNEEPEETERVETALQEEQRQHRIDEVIRAMDRQHASLSRRRARIDPDSDIAPRPREERWPAVVWRAPEGCLPEGCRVTGTLDAWELASALMNLAQLKKELRYDLAGLLERLHIGHDWHALGFASFGEYCENRLGFGRRRAERLIQFRRGLDRYELLRHAYLASGISYTAALLLLRILHPKTEKIWVEWADGVTYRELERVVEFASTYMLPEAEPSVFESYIRELERISAEEAQGVDETVDETDDATAFEKPGDLSARTGASDPDVPLGCALPPARSGDLPIIAGLPTDLALAPPEFCITRIRFWVPAEVLELVYRALRCCRLAMRDPMRDTWLYLEVILVHFIQSQDTPETREVVRRHKIIARDGFKCRCPGCTSRENLHGHHMQHSAQCGPDEDWNLAAACAGHHLPGLHGGVVVMGGWAPDHIITKLGVNPRTGKALVCYINERRVSNEKADAELAVWRAARREGESAGPAHFADQ